MYDEPDDLDELQPSPQAKGSVKVNASLIEPPCSGATGHS